MNSRLCLSILLVCFAPLFTGCAAHYQDLLRDRDAEIRELEAQLANARAENEDLAARERRALAQLSEANARPVEASSDEGGLVDRVQREVGDDVEVRMDSGRLSIGIDNTVTFSSGSTKLKSSADGVLRRVASVLQTKFAGRRIYVTGHTDTDPIKKTKGRFRDNRHLSMERADAVARYLISKCGVPESAVAVIGFGPFNPRAMGGSSSDKARNRRVEIVVGEML